MAAIAAVTGCRSEAPPPPPPPPVPVPPVPVETVPTPGPVAPEPTPPNQPQPTAAQQPQQPPVAAYPNEKLAKPQWCTQPKPMCVGPNARPSSGMLPPDPRSFRYDVNGCLPAAKHGGSCTGRTVIEGPRFDHGQCCYVVCQGPVPPCGRPLYVAGMARMAPAPPATPHPHAARWLRDAWSEHASIASFARFALELMAIGAPLCMVAAAHEAAVDEIAHTQICLRRARALIGPVAGPGRLPIHGVVIRRSLDDVAVAAVIEGCIGETIAALEAPLDVIARDELRHAQLAWRFVAWAVQRGAREAVRRAFAAALPNIDARIAREVIVPCMEALCQTYRMENLSA